MADEDYMSRQDHFVDGATGLMQGTNPATSMPVQQADPQFQAASSLLIPNSLRSVNGQSDRSYLQTVLPYADESSPMSKAQQGAQQQTRGIQPANRESV